MKNRQELEALLGELKARLPQMVKENPDDEFWVQFAGEADVIEDEAGENLAWVKQELDAMLAEHGRNSS